ncbi:hypothetical protein SLEP1_g47714 [Rubroshorea leprosula]|uniref:Uncharacterized protein n=1 Tax=Rubroshorea leprosula TaxID=152421 RepID=A0AAV5LU95_9ROSI|nr:hypothetical protein SLEP1_g47714 [Rubroshorea leprosula]
MFVAWCIIFGLSRESTFTVWIQNEEELCPLLKFKHCGV